MHGRRFLVQELYYGTDSASFFLRIDFAPNELRHVPGLEIRLTLEARERARFSFALGPESVQIDEGDSKALEARFGRVLELRLPLDAAAAAGEQLRFQLSLWHENLPLDALPVEGWIELDPAEPGGW
jgi:hypothetical protein